MLALLEFDSNSNINIMDFNCHYIMLIGIEFGIEFSLKSDTVLNNQIVGTGNGFNGQTRKRKWSCNFNTGNNNNNNNNNDFTLIFDYLSLLALLH